jgi:hypothetical protein
MPNPNVPLPTGPPVVFEPHPELLIDGPMIGFPVDPHYPPPNGWVVVDAIDGTTYLVPLPNTQQPPLQLPAPSTPVPPVAPPPIDTHVPVQTRPNVPAQVPPPDQGPVTVPNRPQAPPDQPPVILTPRPFDPLTNPNTSLPPTLPNYVPNANDFLIALNLLDLMYWLDDIQNPPTSRPPYGPPTPPFVPMPPNPPTMSQTLITNTIQDVLAWIFYRPQDLTLNPSWAGPPPGTPLGLTNPLWGPPDYPLNSHPDAPVISNASGPNVMIGGGGGGDLYHDNH